MEVRMKIINSNLEILYGYKEILEKQRFYSQYNQATSAASKEYLKITKELITTKQSIEIKDEEKNELQKFQDDCSHKIWVVVDKDDECDKVQCLICNLFIDDLNKLSEEDKEYVLDFHDDWIKNQNGRDGCFEEAYQDYEVLDEIGKTEEEIFYILKDKYENSPQQKKKLKK